MTIPAELPLAIERLLGLARAFGTGDAYDDLRHVLIPPVSRALDANDVDSAIARWAEALGFAIVPLDVDDAAESLVEALHAAHGASR